MQSIHCVHYGLRITFVAWIFLLWMGLVVNVIADDVPLVKAKTDGNGNKTFEYKDGTKIRYSHSGRVDIAGGSATLVKPSGESTTYWRGGGRSSTRPGDKDRGKMPEQPLVEKHITDGVSEQIYADGTTVKYNEDGTCLITERSASGNTTFATGPMPTAEGKMITPSSPPAENKPSETPPSPTSPGANEPSKLDPETERILNEGIHQAVEDSLREMRPDSREQEKEQGKPEPEPPQGGESSHQSCGS